MRSTFLCGLIGAGIQLSRSPALHEREADEQGLRYVYKLIDLDKLGVGVEALPELLNAARQMGFAGLNITYPCKQAIIPLLDELSEDARALNAVNTVVIRDGRMTGHNTDWSGFAEGFRRGLPDAKRDRVVLLRIALSRSASESRPTGRAGRHLDIAGDDPPMIRTSLRPGVRVKPARNGKQDATTRRVAQEARGAARHAASWLRRRRNTPVRHPGIVHGRRRAKRL